MLKNHNNLNHYLLCFNSVELKWVLFFWKGLPSAPVIICLQFLLLLLLDLTMECDLRCSWSDARLDVRPLLGDFVLVHVGLPL